jgi:hypothetical protein
MITCSNSQSSLDEPDDLVQVVDVEVGTEEALGQGTASDALLGLRLGGDRSCSASNASRSAIIASTKSSWLVVLVLSVIIVPP